MKKTSLLILMILMITSFLFAAEVISPKTNSAYGALATPYKNMDVRSLGMGGVGIAGTSNAQSIWSNPAGLADKKVQVSIPALGVTLYHPLSIYKLYDSGIIEDIMNENIEIGSIYDNEYINKIFSYGYGKIADINAGISFSAGGFGLGIAVQDSLLTYLEGQIASTQIINQLNAEIRMGYGFKINFSEKSSLDIGASVGFNYLLYTESFGINDLMKIMAEENILKTKPIMAGWTIPINVGVRFNMPFGLKIATAVNNINFGYNMHAFANFDEFKGSPFGSSSQTSFKFTPDFSWDFGIAWDPDWSWGFKPTIEANLIDIWGLIEDGDLSGRAWMNHLKLGAELKGLWIFDIRGGLDSGYWTVGAGLNLYALRIEAAYYWHEFGSVAGEKGIDGLTIQFNLGW